MTGIERLRKLSEDLLPYRLWDVIVAGTEEDWDCHKGDSVTVSDVLSAIADQIEREHNVSDREEHEAAVWVREHGGLDAVRSEWSSRVAYEKHEQRRQRLLGHIAECEEALGRRNERIKDLGRRFSDLNRRFGDLTRENAELRKRAMPQGYEWPRYEDGTTVCFGDEASRLGEVFEVSGICLYRDGSYALNFRAYSKDECVKRPEEVLASDGEPLEVGQAVWHVATGREYIVRSCTNGGAHLSRDGRPAGYCRAEYLTHQRPVLDAEGVPIKKGDTVYLLPGEWCDEFPCLGFHGGEELEVFDDGEAVHVSGSVQCREKEKKVGFRGVCYPQPSQLTHTKPEPPKRLCRDCRHWQGDPSASHMGVCFNSYRERCCVDSYAAQLDYAEACEDFEGRGE